MIILKLYELESILPSLNKLLDKELPLKISYSLFKLAKRLNEEYKFYNTKRQELIEKYAERDEKNNIKTENNTIPIQKELVEECNSKLLELNNFEFEIEFKPISIDLLGDLSITPKDLLILDKFIKD